MGTGPSVDTSTFLFSEISLFGGFISPPCPPVTPTASKRDLHYTPIKWYVRRMNACLKQNSQRQTPSMENTGIGNWRLSTQNFKRPTEECAYAMRRPREYRVRRPGPRLQNSNSSSKTTQGTGHTFVGGAACKNHTERQYSKKVKIQGTTNSWALIALTKPTVPVGEPLKIW